MYAPTLMTLAVLLLAQTTVIHSRVRKELTCLTFDNGFTGLFGEWIKVSNVQRVSTGCKYGSCAFFDGLKSGLEIPRFASAFSVFQKFSVSFWYRRTSEAPAYILSNLQCGDQPSISVMGFYRGDIQASLYTSRGSYTIPVNVEEKVWHHMVITHGKQKMRMYMDGALISEGRLPGRLYNSRCSLSIGVKPVNSSPIIGYYRGYFDQMCVYRKCLNQADVTRLYNDPSIVNL